MLPECTIMQLSGALRKSWGKDTAWKNKGEKGKPDGQCFVTALIVQDFFGGDILRHDFGNGDIHFWNRLPNGKEIDLTSGQFPDGDGINAVSWLRGEGYRRKVTRHERLRGRVLKRLEELDAP